MKKKQILFFLALASAQCIMAQVPSFVKDSLDVYVERSMKSWKIPGLAVCIVKDGQVVLMKGYGTKAMDGNDKVDENTLFMIGSNTKAFTATSLALLDYEKKLSLDDKVTKWIPEFKLENKAAGQQAIIRDLLCHRLGFQTFQGDFTYWTSNLSRKEVIEKMGHIKAEYPFRTRYGYTNAAFLTAGEIIPKAIGISWEDFIRQRIFNPLGMTRSLALSSQLAAADNKALPHTVADGQLIKIPIPIIDNLAPAGSISSSANDLSKWVLMQLNEGMFNGKEVIPAAVIREIRKPHTIVGDGKPMFNEGHFALYGLGFFLEEYEGRKIVSHTGGVNGFVTSITLAPEEKLGIIVLTNNDQNGLFEALKWEILDAYLALPYRNYSDVYLKNGEAYLNGLAATDKKKMDSVGLHLKTALPLSSYAGNYFNGVYGNMMVVLEDGGLRMKFSHHPNMYANLESLGGNRFYAIFSDPEFSKAVFPFKVENQKVKSVTVKVADFIEYNAYEFSKIAH
ncbi:MAG TPA: serine hydrolase [Puia sp.]|nr:serine hydrolase [Puia sp.]